MKTPLTELAAAILGLADGALTSGTTNEAICSAARDAAHLLETEARRLLYLAKQLNDAAQHLADLTLTEEAA